MNSDSLCTIFTGKSSGIVVGPVIRYSEMTFLAKNRFRSASRSFQDIMTSCWILRLKNCDFQLRMVSSFCAPELSRTLRYIRCHCTAFELLYILYIHYIYIYLYVCT